MRRALVVLVMTTAASAQAQTNDTSLFASHDPLKLVIEAPWRRIQRSRGEPYAGVLSYETAAGAIERLTVEIETRGHSRLEHCRFPPLRLDFKRKQLEGTVFAGQNKLKLVTQCERVGRSADNVLLEHWIYRALNLLTPQSFRTRLAHVRYRDTAGKRRETIGPAFFIEDDERMAERVALDRIVLKRLEPARIDPHYLALVTLFQFMIGNTDWSVIAGFGDENCCHNGKVLGTSGARSAFLVVPYDFDQAGLIDADYAMPFEGFGIRSVRQRVYRGFCSTNPQLHETVAKFDAARDAMAALLDVPDLTDGSRRRALKYLDSFFAVIDDPRRITKQILNKCRGTDAGGNEK